MATVQQLALTRKGVATFIRNNRARDAYERAREREKKRGRAAKRDEQKLARRANYRESIEPANCASARESLTPLAGARSFVCVPARILYVSVEVRASGRRNARLVLSSERARARATWHRQLRLVVVFLFFFFFSRARTTRDIILAGSVLHRRPFDVSTGLGL